MAIVWKKIKGPKRRKMRCAKCDNPLLLVITEPVKRQVKSLVAHHLRIVAKCPICRGTKVIKLGGPN